MFSKRRHLLIVVAGLALLLSAGWLYTQRLPMARLRASGAPTTFADLTPEPIPAELNAAAGIEALGPRLETLPEAFWSVWDDATGGSAQLKAAQRLSNDHAEAIAEVIEAIKRPEYASTLVSSPGDRDQSILDSVVQLRSVFRVLDFKLRVALGEGDAPQAAETAVLILDLSKRVEHEPFLTSRLVACAVQGIAIDGALRAAATDKLDEETLGRLDRGLAALEERSSVIPTLESERVLSLAKMSQWSPPSRWLYAGSVLEFYENAIEAMGCPVDQRLAAAQAIKTGQGFFTGSLSDSLQRLVKAEDRTATQAREARESLREIATELPPLEP